MWDSAQEGSDGGGADSEHSLSCGSGPEAKVGAGTVSERNRKLMPQYPAVWGRGLEDTEVTGSGWLHSVKA